MKRRREDALRSVKQRRLPLHPVLDLPLNPEEQEPPFLRPKTRTRVRRARRGPLGRTILAAQAAGMLFLASVAGWAGYARVMASERLRVTRVEIRGRHFLGEHEVRERLGSAVGGNILGLDIETLKAQLRSSPWVADAAISRALPDTLRVEIKERTPLALAEAEQLQLMDESGTLIEPYGPRTAAFDLPIVRGLKGASSEELRDRAQRAGGLLRDLGDLQAEVSEVEVEKSGELTVVLRGAGEVLRMGAPPYRRKLQTYLELREDLARRCPDAEYFDLRFKDRIFVLQPAARPPDPPAPPPRTGAEDVVVPPAVPPESVPPAAPGDADADAAAEPELPKRAGARGGATQHPLAREDAGFTEVVTG